MILHIDTVKANDTRVHSMATYLIIDDDPTGSCEYRICDNFRSIRMSLKEYNGGYAFSIIVKIGVDWRRVHNYNVDAIFSQLCRKISPQVCYEGFCWCVPLRNC